MTQTHSFRGGHSPQVHYLLLLDDSDPGLDVGEGVHGGEHSIPAMLLMQLSPGPSLQSEGGGVHEPPKVEILLEVGHPVFHLILIKVRLHKSDLYVGLEEEVRRRKREPSSQGDVWRLGRACWDRGQHSFPIRKPPVLNASGQNSESALLFSTPGKERLLRLWKGVCFREE